MTTQPPTQSSGQPSGQPPVTIRGYRPADLPALEEICIRTGHQGGDARQAGYREPEILPAIFVSPYAALAPDLVFVADDGVEPIGYIVGAADSAAFFAEFATTWLPAVAGRFPPLDAPSEEYDHGLRDLLHHADRMLVPEIAAAYPAHLHIDLLPHGQRRGLGSRLMHAFLDALRARGVPGVHLGMNPANTGARAFYDSLGFTELSPPTVADGSAYLGLTLDP